MRAGIDSERKLVDAARAGTLLSVPNIGVKSLTAILDKLQERQSYDAYPEMPTASPVLDESEAREITYASGKREALSEFTEWQTTVIRRQLANNGLHPRVLVDGISLGKLIDPRTDIELDRRHSLASAVLETVSVAQELQELLRDANDREFSDIMIPRYGLRGATLQELGDRMGVSRERVRQLERRLGQKLMPELRVAMGGAIHNASTVTAPKIQTAVEIAADMGGSVSYAQWQEELQSRGLLGEWTEQRYRGLSVLEVLVSVLRLVGKHGDSELALPEEVDAAVELAVCGRPKVRLCDATVTREQKRIRRRILQHARHSGAANARWLGQDLCVDMTTILSELASLGFVHITGSWYQSPVSPDGPDVGHLQVLHRAICKMSRYCGRLDIHSLCGGVRKANFRKQFPVPPPDTMEKVLVANGYSCQNGLYWWDGSISDELSKSESVILEAFRSTGPVLNHEELARAIGTAGLSFPALHSALKHSPLFRRIEPGLYVVRGTRPSIQDLERAREASQDVPLDLEVGYEAGCVVASMNVSVISLVAGTIAITSPDFPNLAGDWTCKTSDEVSHTVRITERGVAGLRFISEALGIQPGDRITLTFNPRLHTVSICLEEQMHRW